MVQGQEQLKTSPVQTPDEAICLPMGASMYGVTCWKGCCVQLTLTLPHRVFADTWLYLMYALHWVSLCVMAHPHTLCSSGRTAIHFTSPVLGLCHVGHPCLGVDKQAWRKGTLRGHVGILRNGTSGLGQIRLLFSLHLSCMGKLVQCIWLLRRWSQTQGHGVAGG